MKFPFGGGFVKKIVCIFAFFMAAGLPVAAQTQQPIRVRCGASAYTDSLGRVWQSDFGFNAGATSTYSTTSPVSGTPDPKLFQYERYANGSSPMIYNFPVANGAYHVNLYFAEIFSSVDFVGGRIFNVKIEGNLIFSNLDIFKAVGANAALVKGADVVVQNGALTIEFDSVYQNAKIDAIEILPAASGTPTGPPLTLNFKYPDGTPVAGTLNYSISSSLLSFQGTAALVNGQAQCVLYANPSALGISAQFTVNLNLTDSAGHQMWQLSLAMNPAQVNLGAIQTSSLNVVVQKL
jgi:hypothetical protein